MDKHALTELRTQAIKVVANVENALSGHRLKDAELGESVATLATLVHCLIVLLQTDEAERSAR